jgi:hypothetical protein
METATTFDASPCEGVCKGTCVMLVDDKIIYAGPLKGAPQADGKMILLHSDDFDRLRSHVEKRRH